MSIAKDYDRLRAQALHLAELGARTRQQATHLAETLRRLGHEFSTIDFNSGILQARQFGEIVRNPRRFSR